MKANVPNMLHCYQAQTRWLRQPGRLIDGHNLHSMKYCLLFRTYPVPISTPIHLTQNSSYPGMSQCSYLGISFSYLFWMCNFSVRSGKVKWGSDVQGMTGIWYMRLQDLLWTSGSAHSSSPSLSQPNFCYCEMNLIFVQMSHRRSRSNEIMGGKIFF